ncbi:MAG: hypothetical protein HY331_06440 [Chloroflexi bacterium]|nr:hypothetical protein [Chloroflexota bacterium]
MLFHSLRHTHATLLLQNVNPKIVSDRLGHAIVAIMLDTYSHVLPGMQDTAVHALEGIFGKRAASQGIRDPPAIRDQSAWGHFRQMGSRPADWMRTPAEDS